MNIQNFPPVLYSAFLKNSFPNEYNGYFFGETLETVDLDGTEIYRVGSGRIIDFLLMITSLSKIKNLLSIYRFLVDDDFSFQNKELNRAHFLHI